MKSPLCRISFLQTDLIHMKMCFPIFHSPGMVDKLKLFHHELKLFLSLYEYVTYQNKTVHHHKTLLYIHTYNLLLD